MTRLEDLRDGVEPRFTLSEVGTRVKAADEALAHHLTDRTLLDVKAGSLPVIVEDECGAA